MGKGVLMGFWAHRARPWIHWIAPAIFITIANLGLCTCSLLDFLPYPTSLPVPYPDTIYLATYNYLGDVYDRYSSSAQAAQSLLRGVLGACFPFFGIIMVRPLPPTLFRTSAGADVLAFRSTTS